jgi:hypothetical protein
MNDNEVKRAVLDAGEPMSPGDRADAAQWFARALAGNEAVSSTVTPLGAVRTAHRARGWGVAISILGLAAATLAVVLLVRPHDNDVVVPATDPATTQPAFTVPATTEPSSTEPAAIESATTVPVTTAPATTYPTSYGTTPMPVGSFPIAAPDVPLPALTLVDSHVVGAGETVAGADVTYPVYQFDASGLVVLQASPCCVSNSPAAYQATAYAFDGSVRWSMTVPGSNGRVASIALGPDDVLYAARSELNSVVYVLEAYATRGSKAGTMLGSWPTDWGCTEMSWCGYLQGYFDTTGIRISEADGRKIIPYLNNDGQPSGATMPLSALPVAEANRAEFDYWPLEDPTGHVLSGPDEFGHNNSSMRTRVRLGTSSWTFDAFGVTFWKGSLVGFTAQPAGGLLGTFETCARPERVDGARQRVVGVLEASDKVSMYSLPSSGWIRAESIVGHEIYGVNFDGKFLNLVRYRIPG